MFYTQNVLLYYKSLNMEIYYLQITLSSHDFFFKTKKNDGLIFLFILNRVSVKCKSTLHTKGN